MLLSLQGSRAPAANKALTISAFPVLVLFPPNSLGEVGKSCLSCAHPLGAGIRLYTAWASPGVLLALGSEEYSPLIGEVGSVP